MRLHPHSKRSSRSSRFAFGPRALALALRVSGMVAVAALASGARDAEAQTATTTTTTSSSVAIIGTVSRLPDTLPAHPNSVPVNIINYSDCINNEVLSIPLSITNPGAAQSQGATEIQAWAGEGSTDCTQLANITQATAVCWRVGSGIDGTQATTTANLRVQDIISEYGISTKSITPPAASSSVCSNLTPGPHQITISIFYVSGSGALAGSTAASYAVTAAMQASALSGAISIGAGDGLLKLSLPDTSDTTISGYQIYCDPPLGQAATDTTTPDAAVRDAQCTGGGADTAAGDADAGDGAIESGTALDGSAADATVSAADAATEASCGLPTNVTPVAPAGSCSSSVLVSGASDAGVDDGGVDEAGNSISTVVTRISPPPPAKYQCGSVSGLSSTVLVKGLNNDTSYAVAAAATDIYGNTGPLSALACGTPKPTTDFWDTYRQDGGGAGGGFCALQAVGVPVGSGFIGLVMVASTLTFIRRRRRS